MALLAGAALGSSPWDTSIDVLVVVRALRVRVLGGSVGRRDDVQAAIVDDGSSRSIMPRFHAGFSVGTVAGALVGAAMVALHVSVTAAPVLVAAVVAIGVPVAVRAFIADHDASERRPPTPGGRVAGGRSPPARVLPLGRAAHPADRPLRPLVRVRGGSRQ